VTALVAGLACLFGPPSPVLHSQGDQVAAVRVCADTFAPPPAPERALPVRPLGRVRVDMGTETDSLSATLRGRDGELPVAAVGESKRWFAVRLPRRLKKQPALELHAVYDAGEATFVALLEPPAPASPPQPVLRAGGRRLAMARGSFCWSAPPVGLCVDTKSPVTATALPVRRGGDVRVDTRLAADQISASIRGGSRDLQIGPVDASKRRFAVSLPHRLRQRAVLELFVRYPQGDGSFGARLRAR
jgi:hypothetical protein